MLAVAVPAAFADKGDKPDKAPRGRSLATCASFDQADKGEDAEVFTIRNACQVPIDCAISWKVVCAPESKKRKTTHAGSAKIASLADGAEQTTDASAAVCGNDAWAIEQVEWSCSPNKD